MGLQPPEEHDGHPWVYGSRGGSGDVARVTGNGTVGPIYLDHSSHADGDKLE